MCFSFANHFIYIKILLLTNTEKLKHVALKKENLHKELEEERFEKFPKLHWLIRICGTEVLYLRNRLIMTLVILYKEPTRCNFASTVY